MKKPIRKRRSTRQRMLAQNDRIESAAIALHGKPFSEMEKLAGSIVLLKQEVLINKTQYDSHLNWETEKKLLQAQFATLLFPALWKNDQDKFKELCKAMDWAIANVPNPQPKSPLRYHLSLMPRALIGNTAGITAWLKKRDVEFGDASNLCRVLRDIYPPDKKRRPGRPKLLNKGKPIA